MSWGVIMDKERMLPSSGSNASNEVKLEANKAHMVRPMGREPHAFFEHGYQNDARRGSDQAAYRTAICPKTKADPHASCLVCDAQNIGRKLRFALPVWDYEAQAPKILVGGADVFQPMGTLHEMGLDITTLDFAVTKSVDASKAAREGTSYGCVNVPVNPENPRPAIPEGTAPLDHITPYLPQDMSVHKTACETVGLVWEQIVTLKGVPYPASVDAALNHEMPNGKFKGKTLREVLQLEDSYVAWLAGSDRQNETKGCAQVIMVNLKGAQIEGVPVFNGQAQPAPSASADIQQSATPPAQPAPTGTVDTGALDAQLNTAMNAKFGTDFQQMVNAMTEATGKTSLGEMTAEEKQKLLAHIS